MNEDIINLHVKNFRAIHEAAIKINGSKKRNAGKKIQAASNYCLVRSGQSFWKSQNQADWTAGKERGV